DSSSLIYGRRSRPLPGQDRRGEPVRPVARRPLVPASRAHTRIHIHEVPLNSRSVASSSSRRRFLSTTIWLQVST
ncbi:MAG: hypothetical protein ACTHNY_05800, partial [Solirubrobacterales bacterium]